MNNYHLPPRNAAEQQQQNSSTNQNNGGGGGGAEGTNARKSNFTILSQDVLMHPSGVNSELAGNVLSA